MKDLYWHIRPSPDFGTVEFRVCDIPPTLEEAMALTAFIHCLTIWILRSTDNSSMLHQNDELTYMLYPENMMMAQRYGLDGEIFIGKEIERINIREDIERLLSILKPLSIELNCHHALENIHSILIHGNGAERQRRCFEQTGSYEEVTRMLQEEQLSNKVTSFTP